MAKYRALRGVCIGVDRVVTPKDDPFELSASDAQFLTSIKAVEKVEEAAPAAAPAAAAAKPDNSDGAKAPKKGS